ncbi:unnamed protein product, partial [Meganyctiphanes norvegica]
SGKRYTVTETQINESPPILLTTFKIRRLSHEDISTYHCNASIDNDNNRMKSLAVLLNEIPRPSTEIGPPDTYYNVGRPSKNLRKPPPKQSRINDIVERYEKPTSFTPDLSDKFLGNHVDPAYVDQGESSKSWQLHSAALLHLAVTVTHLVRSCLMFHIT